MAQEHGIDVYGPSSTDGIRASDHNSPNFPPVHHPGAEVMKYQTDLISDPADPADTDPANGWQKGVGIGGGSN